MGNGKTYIDIDDFNNTENVIKKIDPAFNDIASKMPAPVANFAQQQMSMAIRRDDPKRRGGNLKGHHKYLLYVKGVGDAT